MIRAEVGTPITIDNVLGWIDEFLNTEFKNHLENQSFYRNEQKMVLPYAKKLVTIATAATLGDGIKMSESRDEDISLTESQKKTLRQIERLWKHQTISSEDLAVIKNGSIFGLSYELCFMSSDENPLPKCKALSPLNTFVVWDDTVEDNSLYGIYFTEAPKNDMTVVDVYDEKYRYSIRLPYLVTGTRSACAYSTSSIDRFFDVERGSAIADNVRISREPHHMGRMPITVYFNNDDLQGDFEQVKPTILKRNEIDSLATDDAETIASNYLVFYNNEIGGITEEEKERTVRQIGKTKVIELSQGDVKILTKSEAFSMISVYGQDVENKIYDLSMIINFSSEEFAGNTTGVALRLKLFPFKKLVGNKDHYIEKLYRRRIKMYQYALSQKEQIAELDPSDIEIEIHRTWEENILELAQTIATLAPLGLFSEKYLIEKMPDGEYEIEIGQREIESEEKAKRAAENPDPNNSVIGDFNGLMRSLITQNGSD